MTLCRVERALEEIGLRNQYIQNFEENGLDDETVELCFVDPDFASSLNTIIPAVGHRMKFQKAFKALLVDTSSGTQNATLNGHVPLAPLSNVQNQSGGVQSVKTSRAISSYPNGPAQGSIQAERMEVDGNDSEQPVVEKTRRVTSSQSNGPVGPVQASSQAERMEFDGSDSEEQLMDPLEPQPVQIMDFKESKRGTPSEIVFHEKKLQDILNKTKSKRVAVVAIAGPSRKGKSFFLNFVLKYLNSLKTGDKDWMGWRKPRNGLKGFDWKNCAERVTTGIWMWSEPFTLKSKTGDCDLLIMDTQGVFDEHTTHREWSILVGLGLLTSSCLIFNIMSDLQEDNLQVFENFLSFGLMAMNEKDGRTPFQKLVFLIRDWNNPGQYTYGSSGGKRFIGDKLVTKTHHKESHKRVREQLKECFEDVSCFLLPHPGEKVLALDFDGSITESETFAVEIERCVLELMDPLKLPLKKINGNLLTGQDILATFQLYCELFNSDEVPNPESVFEITVKTCNAVIIKKCIDAFGRELDAQLEKRPFFLPEDLDRLRIPSERSCIEAFDRARKMGDPSMIEEARRELLQQVESCFEDLKQKNAHQLEKVVSKAIDACIQGFENAVEECFQNDENGFVSNDKLEGVYSEALDEAIETFTSSCGIRDRMMLPEAVDRMCQVLKSRMSGFRDKNSLMKREAEKDLEQFIQNLVNSYVENVTTQVEDRIVPEEELLRLHESEKKKAVFELEEQEPHEQLLENGLHTLKTKIDTEFERMKNAVKTSNEKIRLHGQSIVTQAVEQYKIGLKSQLTLNRERFQELHEEFWDTSKTLLRSSLPIKDAKFVDENEEDLENQINNAYDELIELVERREDELRSSLRQSKDEAAEEYSVSIKNRFPQDDQSPVEASLLQDAHDQEKSKVMQSFKESCENALKTCPGADQQLLDGLVVDLEDRIDQTFQSINALNQLRMDNHDAKAKVHLGEVKDAYVRMMKQALEDITEEDELKQKQADAKKESIDSFKAKVEATISSPDVLQDLLEDLGTYIDREYVDILELFKLEKEQDECTVRTALLDAREYYNEEMEKHFQAKDWLEQSELAGLHQKIGDAAVQKAQQELDLNQRQEKQLRGVITVIYNKYADKNLLRMPQDSYPIGIDLGTTYSCVAVCVKGKIKVIPCDEKTTVPSYVAFNDDHSISVGEAAKDQAFRRPESTIFDAKRLIGRKFSDQIVKDDMELWPFTVVGDSDQPRIKIPGHSNTYRPEEVSARVLSQLKKMAEDYLNKEVTNAVVTVPAYFNDSQRQATKDAAQIAGLNAIILNEPTSAAIAYELHRSDDLRRNVLIFDLGGGTFDVAVLQMKGGKIDVKAIGGHTHLGGEDFDNEMVKLVIEKVKKKEGIDLARGKNSANPEEKRATAVRLRRIRTVCEKQKRLLSSSTSTTINIPRIHDSLDVTEVVTRKEFEDMNMPKLKQCIDITAKVISDASMSKADIDDIVLIGGSTRIPKIRELLSEFFDGKSLNSTINADEAVAFGAAVHAALEFGKSDEVPKDIQVSNVSPLSLGIDVLGGRLSVIIARNTPVPFSKTKDYYTTYDGQTSVDIDIYEGEERMSADNNLLGKFVLSGIPSAPKHQEPLDVTMNIDREGILHVKAVCRSTGGSKDIKIEAHKGRMSGREIASAKSGAENFNW